MPPRTKSLLALKASPRSTNDLSFKIEVFLALKKKIVKAWSLLDTPLCREFYILPFAIARKFKIFTTF